MYNVTPKQKKVYDFICKYIKKNDLSPTFREIMEGCGIKSTAHVSMVIDALVLKKFLLKDYGMKRSVRPVK